MRPGPGPVVVIGSCLPDHLPMYARYGYVRLPGTDRFESHGQPAIAIACRTAALPQPTRSHVERLRRAIGDGDGAGPATIACQSCGNPMGRFACDDHQEAW